MQDNNPAYESGRNPNQIEDYVHRIGRTGRAGRKGTAPPRSTMGQLTSSTILIVESDVNAGQR